MRIPKAARERVPAGTLIVRFERMSPAFTKYHLSDGRALHRFRREEPNGTPHDHPWSFETEILDGGYVEEVFTVAADGSWSFERVSRLPGAKYSVNAAHIHRIVELPTGECWTLVRAGPHERETRFWRFGDDVRSRAWHERRYVRWTAGR